MNIEDLSDKKWEINGQRWGTYQSIIGIESAK
jgi:hypothetical protein